MTFRHVRTDDPTSPHNDSRTRLLEKVLARHAAEGFDVIELRRQMGKAGYVPTEHRWEDDGHGDDLTDDDGGLLLIGGMPPADLAAEIIDTARQHTEETNDRKNYRVVGLRRIEGEDGDEEQEELFRFLLPATMFGAVGADPATASESREHHDALMAANLQLQRQNDALFRVLMDVVRQYPTILGKSAELLEQLGDQLGGGRQQDLQQVLSILEHESTREQRWMEHDLSKQRSSQRAEMFGKSIDIAGPDLMVLVRKVIEAIMQQAAAAQGQGAAQPGQATSPSEPAAKEPPRSKAKAKGTTTATPPPSEPAAPKPSSSRYAQRLEQALAKVPAEGITKARAMLSEDDWSLIEAAREAADDEEFSAIFTKLGESWTAKGEAATQALMAQLVDVLGIQPALALGQLIKEVRGR
ncbi:hypothetical protein [Paraliomyxa miuraensis]|uniref:hypothetical protein n=1 Tax=Paraliomyxa miuraensis TaxID=376150 RepID=UPI00225315FA|nr:hypothetical protein [Paraliomyxa miuraensis]MCX4244203.1 hypothetical protein [Paraliomyxa miuraensis]